MPIIFKKSITSREGEHFISGGEDKLVKLWGYDEGLLYYRGTGHSGGITRVIIKTIKKEKKKKYLYLYIYTNADVD